MHHRNAPLTVVGRQRAVAQVIDSDRPIAHVAAEFHIARTTLSKWVGRYRDHGEAGLEDRSSAPANRPTRLPIWALELIEDAHVVDLAVHRDRDEPPGDLGGDVLELREQRAFCSASSLPGASHSATAPPVPFNLPSVRRSA